MQNEMIMHELPSRHFKCSFIYDHKKNRSTFFCMTAYGKMLDLVWGCVLNILHEWNTQY
jgi:hypothetical protein